MVPECAPGPSLRLEPPCAFLRRNRMTTTRKSRAIASAVALTLSLSACGGATTDRTTVDAGATPNPPASTTATSVTTTIPDTTTTVTDSTTQSPAPGTAEAIATLDAIRVAAGDGDVNALAALALSSEATFTASFGQSFGDPADLAAFWATFQEPTVPEVVLGLLDAGYTRTFANNDDGTQVGINVSPAVMGEEATATDRLRLESIFGEETVAGWYADGMYLGWRLGVDDDGVWRFLVAGD